MRESFKGYMAHPYVNEPLEETNWVARTQFNMHHYK
jgi:hypothetical protein